MQDLLIELLQVSLGCRRHLSRVPSNKAWHAVFEEAQRQAIAGVLVNGLEQLPEEERPYQDLLLQWIGIAQINESTYALHQKRAKQVTSFFHSAGYSTVILKGLSSAFRYTKPEHRECGDIDIWIPSVMTGESKRADVMQLLKSKFEITGIVWHHAVVDLFRDVSVEVHFYPIWLNNPWNNKYLQSWFRTMALGRCKREKDNLGYVCTTDEFDVVYQLAHCFHHLMDEGLGLRQVLDYYYMVKNCEKKTSDESFAIIRKIGLEKFAGAMMWVLREICLLDSEYYICEPNPKEGVFLMSEILEGGNMGCYRMDGKRKNTLARWWMMFKHYPSEVFWMVPWKIWQKGWLLLNKS